MRSNKLVFSTVVVSVISILFSGCIFSCEKQKKRNNDWLSEEFVPIFEDVNKQLCDTFSYESALYSSGNLKEFSLTFVLVNQNCNTFPKRSSQAFLPRGKTIVKIVRSDGIVPKQNVILNVGEQFVLAAV